MTGLTPEWEAKKRLRNEAMLNRGEPLAEDILAVLAALDAAEKERDEHRMAAEAEADHADEQTKRLSTLKAREERLVEALRMMRDLPVRVATGKSYPLEHWRRDVAQIESVLAEHEEEKPRPRFPLFRSGQTDVSSRAEHEEER